MVSSEPGQHKRRAQPASRESRLKDIVAHYGVDARRLALKWESRERLIELIEQVVQQRARKGEAFRGVSDASR